MRSFSRMIVLIGGIFIATSTGYADMVLPGSAETFRDLVGTEAFVEQDIFFIDPYAGMSLAESRRTFLNDMSGHDSKEVSGIVYVLNDQQGSLQMCVWALLGFGAFRSLSWMKQFSLYTIPDWYHSGAPLRIGHSHAVAPDCCCDQVVCYNQPGDACDDNLSLLYRGFIGWHWIEAQLTLSHPTLRGPPLVY